MSEDKEEISTEIIPTKSSVITISTGANLTELVRRAEIIDQIFKKIMKRDVHYGVIPGMPEGSKPSLFKAGAEKLMAVFNLGAKLEIEKTLLADGHREYLVKCHIIHYPTGQLIGDGVGVCSTMEAKYRYRNTADYEVTDEVIPRDAKERKKEYRKKGYGMKKHEGEWVWVKYGDSEKSENPDVADTYNTVIKMAKKRAQVDGVLSATGASDIFTQDVEDFADWKEADAKEVLEPVATVDTKVPVRKMTVTEGIEVWDVVVDDVKENKTPDGALYYIITFDEDRSCGTKDQVIAEAIANVEGRFKVEVKPGRKPGSYVLFKAHVPGVNAPGVKGGGNVE
jgi:hypothetical protein